MKKSTSKRAQLGSDSDVRNWITYRISRTHSALSTQASQILKQSDELTLSEYRVAIVLEQFKRPLGAIEIANYLKFDKGLVSRTLATLREKGLIESVPSKTDKRSTKHSLNPQGLAVVQRNQALLDPRREAIDACLTPEERALIMDILDRLDQVAERHF